MRAAWLATVAVLVIQGCSQASSTFVANGEWMVSLVTQPQRPAALRPVNLQLTIRNNSSAFIIVDDLTAEAQMPEMSHEKTRLDFRAVSPGRYQATTTFSMDGNWRIVLRGRHSGRGFTAQLHLQVGR